MSLQGKGGVGKSMVAAIALEGANMALSGWRLFDGSSLTFSTLKKRLLLRLNLFKI
jgi:MinD-like ATPase involved in chromosome partitioning or flagellar assembly